MKSQFHVACVVCACAFVITNEELLDGRPRYVCDNCIYERKEREAIENE